jgi:hypothetical protein
MAVTSETVKAAGLSLPRKKTQSMVTDEFLYFFLRLRKGEVRRVVQRVKSLYPDDSPEQLARHPVNTQSVPSFVGGSILRLPQRVPELIGVIAACGVTASPVTRIIGAEAIRIYEKKQPGPAAAA